MVETNKIYKGMLNRILSTIIFAVACVAAVAQEKCTINGCIADTRMGDGKIVKKVQLVSCGEEGQGIFQRVLWLPRLK